MFGRHGSMNVICIITVSPHTHRLHAKLISWCTFKGGQSGADQAVAIRDALATDPCSLNLSVLKKVTSVIGGDGHAVRGGPQRVRPGTGTCELLWRMIHPPRNPPRHSVADALGVAPPVDLWSCLKDDQHLHYSTVWDKFHLEDIIWSRALEACPLASELFQVSGACGQRSLAKNNLMRRLDN